MTEELATLARTLIDAKDPEKALRKTAPKGKGPQLLWEVAAAGLFPLADRAWCDAHGNLVGLLVSNARTAPVAKVRSALEGVAEARLVSWDLLTIVENSYDAHAAEWDRAWESLTPFLQGAVTLRRADRGTPPPGTRREHLLELCASLVASDPHPEVGRADQLARALGEEGAPWERRVLRHVLARGIDQALDRIDVAQSFKHASWEQVRAYFTRFPRSSSFAEVLQATDHPALELWQMMVAADAVTDDDFLRVIVPLAARQGVTLPPDADALLADLVGGGADDPAFLRGLGQLPAPRLRAMFDRLRADDSRFALRLWRFVDDPAVDAEIVESLRALLAAPGEWEAQERVEVLAAAGARARGLFESLRRERGGADLVSARARILLRSGVVRSFVAGDEAPPLTALLPDDDLVFLEGLSDLFGPMEVVQPLFARLSDADRTTLVETWTRLDWDGALSSADYFEVEREQVDVETMPWPALARLMTQTSFGRLYGHRQHVFAAFERAEPLEARMALAEALIGRTHEVGYQYGEVIEAIVYSVAPALEEAGRGLPASWEAALLDRARESSLGGGTVQRLAKLPASWLRPFVHRLLTDESDTARANGEALRDEAFPDEAPAVAETPRAPAEDPVARVRRLAAACGQPLTRRIYALLAIDGSNGSPRRTAARPLGLAEADWPRIDDTPMEHVITLDFEAMPELRARGDFGDDVAAVAVFISKREENEAYTSGHTALVPLDAAELAAGHADEGASYDVVPLDVPEGLFVDDALEELRRAVHQLEARALGAPQFIQSESDGSDEGFLAQLHDSFVPDLNCGDGELYIFAEDAWWEC